ncbi:uncharacterized protein LOC124171318 [Ischnura elegans]|uniref:uncharacterized protein LOC124171318 n=1 Tax=Ischnura elegans TaxID=197161 RepID=UPI001ED87A10|nr:uncharacterized protein LOC124171318 [Ischnura elegans]
MPLAHYRKDVVHAVHFPRTLLPMARFPYKMKPLRKRKKIAATKEGEEMVTMEMHSGPELLRNNDNIYCLRLDKGYQSLLQCVIGEDLTVVFCWKYVAKGIIIQDVMEKGPASQLYPIFGVLQKSTMEYVLVVYDKNIAADYLFFCINPLQPHRLVINELCQKFCWLQQCYYNSHRPLMPYQSRTIQGVSRQIGSDIRFLPRSRIMMAYIIDRRERMSQKIRFTSVESSELQDGLVNYIPRRKDKERRGSQMILALQSRDFCYQSFR